MTAVTSLLNVLSPRARDRLLELAQETAFPAGLRAAVVEQPGPGDLLGRSWLFPPHADRKGRCTVAGSGRA